MVGVRALRGLAWVAPLLVLLAAVIALGLVGCSSKGSDASAGDGGVTTPPPCTDGDPGCIGWNDCPPELEPDPGGAGCREILPPAECAPGTMAVLGDSVCEPVGPTVCPTGFVKAASGWGCDAVLPKAACTGATRDALGSATCVPVGDCNAAFPPSNATMFVNGAYADADLGPTKFRTVTDALVTANDGAVIAVYDGTYAEGINPHASVTVVGHCPDKVHLVGTGLSVWGVLANKVKNVVVQGVTLQDHYEGARAQAGGTLTITDSVIEAPRATGIIAYQPNSLIHLQNSVVRNVQPMTGQTYAVTSASADVGGTIEIESSVLANNYEAAITVTNPGDVSKVRSNVTMNQSVIRDTNVVEHSQAGAGVVASGISTATVTESAILNTRRLATTAFDPTAIIEVERSVLLGSIEDTSGELAGAALITDGATATYTDVTMRGFVQSGIIARTKGAVTVKNSVIDGTVAGSDGVFGMAAFIDMGGTLTMDSSAAIGNAYYGIAVIDAPSVGTLTRVLITDTKRAGDDTLGRGLDIEDGGTLNFDRITLLRNGDESFFVRGETTAGARATANGTRVLVEDGTSRKDGTTGSGINVEKGALFSLDTAAVVRARRAGIIVNDSLGDAGSQAEATITHVIVRDTQAAGDGLGGADPGIAIEGAGIANGGKLTLRSSSVINSVEFGIAVANASAVSLIQSCYVGGTMAEASGIYGHGVVATGGASITINETQVVGNHIGLAFNAASGVVASCVVQGNEVGIQVQQGSTLMTSPNAPDAPTPNVVLVTDDSQFIDNATRIGSGEVPLPTSPLSD